MANQHRVSERVALGPINIEVERMGSGSPILILPSEEALEATSPALADLARDHELIIPSPPGFGNSDKPDWIRSPDDISYVLMDLIERLGLSRAPVIGFSLGGWIAAEIAVKNDSFIGKLVLVDAYGVKIGGPYDRDIADLWLLRSDEVARFKWADPTKFKRDYSTWSDDDLAIVARNVESFARFCWEPYMHNLRLRHCLHRIHASTLLLWGAQDGITPVRYGEEYAKLIPGARFATIADAGHFPHIEQPAAFIKELRAFLA